MKYLSVDRIEGVIAVCQDDDGRLFQIPICDVDLTDTVREGDVLLLTKAGRLIPDPDEKLKRQKAALELLEKLKQ